MRLGKPMNSTQLKRISLSKKHIAAEDGQALLELLLNLAEDGVISNDEIHRLNEWVQMERSKCVIPAVAFLGEVLEGILADGIIEEAERSELHHAILRVLPPELRAQAKEQKRLAVDSARKSANTERNKASERQLAYIESMGGDITNELSKTEASELITSLLNNRPTGRQRMVLRFWDRLDLEEDGREAVSEWMDEWYAQDENHLKAWELWKEEDDDKGERSAFLVERVPVGIGFEYYKRVVTKPLKTSPGCLGLIIGFTLLGFLIVETGAYFI